MAVRKKPKKEITDENDLIYEIISIIFIAISFFIMYSLFSKEGFLGNLIKNVLNGLFGFGAYIFPFMLLAFSLYILFCKKKEFKAQKVIACVISLLCIITFVHILNFKPHIDKFSFFNYISSNYTNGRINNGGLIGTIIGNFLISILGSIGTYIFLTSFLLIAIIMLTNKSFFKFLSFVLNKIRTKIRKYKINVTENKNKKVCLRTQTNKKSKLSVTEGQLSSNEIQILINNQVEENETKLKLTRNQKNNESFKTDKNFNFDEYQFPPIELLNKKIPNVNHQSKSQIIETSKRLEATLKSFGVDAKVVEVSKGPTVTRYELSPGKGVKVSKISGLADDLALNLAAAGIRIEAPIPGKSVVGIEVPNEKTEMVYLREIIEDKKFVQFPANLAFGIGKDIAGNSVVYDISKMPHLLIAGATGSGKSVCINTLITSLIYKAKPDEVKLLMIDPKVVELGIYNGIPHLLIPVVTDPQKAAGALNWAVKEMTRRYSLFAENNVRDMKGYNAIKKENNNSDTLPQIVIIIDELADLMMVAAKDVESSICRLAQMARAAGLHLIIATQRPSVDVITGLIKANIPSRLAFSVSSGTDSRTILDMNGAEKLLGKGDMLFHPMGSNKPQRIQGAFVSDKEVENIVAFVKQNKIDNTDPMMIEEITNTSKIIEEDENTDEFFEASIDLIMKKGKASTSMLQRQFRIGYNRAARIIEELENRGIIGPEDGSKPRQIFMTNFEWQQRKENKLNQP